MENLKAEADKFMKWLADLKQVASDSTNTPIEEIKINSDSAYVFYKDGFTPYQCFRETWQVENDA